RLRRRVDPVRGGGGSGRRNGQDELSVALVGQLPAADQRREPVVAARLAAAHEAGGHRRPLGVELGGGLLGRVIRRLPGLLVYYPVFMLGVSRVKSGSLPAPAVWMGNVLVVLWGLWLLRSVVRR
ncbi:MAG: hypothetical protein ACKOHK_07900, partial [Planctomycetia bacterium]